MAASKSQKSARRTESRAPSKSITKKPAKKPTKKADPLEDLKPLLSGISQWQASTNSTLALMLELIKKNEDYNAQSLDKVSASVKALAENLDRALEKVMAVQVSESTDDLEKVVGHQVLMALTMMPPEHDMGMSAPAYLMDKVKCTLEEWLPVARHKVGVGENFGVGLSTLSHFEWTQGLLEKCRV
jgi:hypothetical protein